MGSSLGIINPSTHLSCVCLSMSKFKICYHRSSSESQLKRGCGWWVAVEQEYLSLWCVVNFGPLHARFADASKLLLLCVPWVTGDFSASSFRIPAGGLLMAMYGLAGETLQEKRSRERRELYEQKLAEW